MLLFTYNDYLDCLENKKIQKAIYIENKRNRIEEMIKKQNEELQSEQDIKIDQIIEKLISSKDEFINFINDFFKIQKWKITKENLKIYSKLNENKSIIYKHKEKEIYFLIKLQKEPNYHILYIILTECIEIINKWKNIKQSNEKAPIIIPIIIYIGRKKWNSKLNKKIKYTNFGDNFINLSYNLINLHDKIN